MDRPVSLARRLWRAVYWRREYAEMRHQYGRTRHLLYFGGDGIGDELLCTAPLRELRKRGISSVGVMTTLPELFRNNPDAESVYPLRHDHVGFLRQINIRVSQTTYIREQRPPDIDVPPQLPIIAEMCRLCGITGEIELRPYLVLSPAEKSGASSYREAIVVQSSRQSASLKIGNKEWIPGRFQEVVTALTKVHRVVQLGLPSDPLLHGAEDLRGRTSLRESAAILSNARGFIGLVGFLMHLARAVNCRSVIIYGGREHPQQSGYSCNENIYTPVSCAPCWRWNSCDYGRKCMTAISTDDVLAAFERLISRAHTQFEVEKMILT